MRAMPGWTRLPLYHLCTRRARSRLGPTMTKGTRPATEDTATGESSAPPRRPARAQVAGEAEKPGAAAPTPAGHGQALAEAVVGSFVERLKAEARR